MLLPIFLDDAECNDFDELLDETLVVAGHDVASRVQK
jgi:hypothetical protein